MVDSATLGWAATGAEASARNVHNRSSLPLGAEPSAFAGPRASPETGSLIRHGRGPDRSVTNYASPARATRRAAPNLRAATSGAALPARTRPSTAGPSHGISHPAGRRAPAASPAR